MYRIDHERHNRLLRINVSGFWKLEDVPPFAAALDAKAREANANSADFDVIVESLEFPVQAEDVADLLTEIMKSGIALTSGRAAVVVGSQLNKLQAERTLAHPRVKVFMSLEAAQNWLSQSRFESDQPLAS